jgi:putative transcriptional regulator
MAEDTSLAGRLLVATPALGDPNFRRTVVLVLRHDDDGALGVVLNRPVAIPTGDALPTWHDAVAPPAILFRGGPVGLDGALGVVTFVPEAGVASPAVDRLVGPFGLVDLDADPDGLRGVTGARVFVGYAGWSAGQLEEEVAAGDWYVLDALPGDVTTPEPELLWRRVLRRQGGTLAIVSTFPEDPSLN